MADGARVLTGLPPVVGMAVLGSALLHASWNALAKAIPHRLLASALMGSTYLVAGIIWCSLVPAPDPASWPFLATSAVLQTGYLLLLTAAYSHGEFRRVYPVARGTAPLLVTLVSLTILGEQLQAAQLAGIALVAAALAWLVLAPEPGPRSDRRSGLPPARASTPAAARRPWGAGLGLAAATGVVIAAYSLVDGLGVRHSASAAGYAAWLMTAQGPLLVTTCVLLAGPRQMIGWLRGGRNQGGSGARRTRPAVMVASGLLGGVLSMAAYAIVLWAQSRASLSLVSATRETSVLFAGVIGALFFAEGFSVRQTVAAVAVVAGIVLMQVG